MAERIRKEPGPDHPITVEPGSERVRVLVNGEVVADSSAPLVLREAGHPPVHYLPRADAVMDRLEASAQTTWCPYKGEARYFHIRVGERRLADAVWSYEEPFPAVEAIRGHLAFYPAKVDAIEITPV
ncbi:MAG TPA: DUF427 domain-containing protein [Geminicoccaceae bacterium]